MSSIIKTNYPLLFGQNNISNDYFALLAGTAISSGTASDIVTIPFGNAGAYAAIDTTIICVGGSNISSNQSPVPTGLTELAQLITDLNNLIPPNADEVYEGGTNIFSPNRKYISSGIMVPSGNLTFNGTNTDQFYILSPSSITFSDVTFSLNGGVLPENIFWCATSAITHTFTNSTTTVVDGIFIGSSQVTFTNTIPYTIYGSVFAHTANITFDGGVAVTLNSPIVCYLKGTKIFTENGYQKIEDLKVGDKVICKGKIINDDTINTNSEFTS